MPLAQAPENLPIYDGTTVLPHIKLKQLLGVRFWHAETHWWIILVQNHLWVLSCSLVHLWVCTHTGGKVNSVKTKSSFLQEVLGALFLRTLGMNWTKTRNRGKKIITGDPNGSAWHMFVSPWYSYFPALHIHAPSTLLPHRQSLHLSQMALQCLTPDTAPFPFKLQERAWIFHAAAARVPVSLRSKTT